MGPSQRTINCLWALACLLPVLTAVPAQAQQPSAAQTSAIRSNCRSDFMANCSGVTPGGMDALNCLRRNTAKLSPSCSAAVSAISPSPAAPPPAAAASPSPAPVQTQMPPAAAAPSAAKPATTSPSKPKRTSPAAHPAATAAPPPPPPAASAAPTVPPLTPRLFIMPERRIAIVRICRAEAATLCAGTPPGGDRIIRCLAANAANLSPQCYDAIARVSRP
jgi:hypothetical protein